MTQVPSRLTLPNGLSAARTAGLADLVAEITGRSDSCDTLPCLAPALLFADDEVQHLLAFPKASSEEVLVQEYQAITYLRDFPVETALVASGRHSGTDKTVDLEFSLADMTGDCARLNITLRLMPVSEIAAAVPARFRKDRLADAVWSDAFIVTQAQVDEYLALSGDQNPIHSDQSAAITMGLPAPVVPGLLLASLVQPFVARAFPAASVVSLKARFLAPLCVGEPLVVGLQPRGLDPATGNHRVRACLLRSDEVAISIVDLSLVGPEI